MYSSVDLYLDKVKHTISRLNHDEMQYFRDFSNSVIDYTNEHPYTYESLIKHFGNPNEVINNYYASLSYKQKIKIAKQLTFSMYLKYFALLMLILSVIVALNYYIMNISKYNEEINNSYFEIRLTTQEMDHENENSNNQ